MQKFLENYLVDSKKGFTFAPLSAPKTGGEVLKKLRKKSSSKIWWIRKKVLPLHHFPLKNRGQDNGESRKAESGKKKEIVLYSNIIEQRSLKYLSS